MYMALKVDIHYHILAFKKMTLLGFPRSLFVKISTRLPLKDISLKCQIAINGVAFPRAFKVKLDISRLYDQFLCPDIEWPLTFSYFIAFYGNSQTQNSTQLELR